MKLYEIWQLYENECYYLIFEFSFSLEFHLCSASSIFCFQSKFSDIWNCLDGSYVFKNWIFILLTIVFVFLAGIEPRFGRNLRVAGAVHINTRLRCPIRRCKSYTWNWVFVWIAQRNGWIARYIAANSGHFSWMTSRDLWSFRIDFNLYFPFFSIHAKKSPPNSFKKNTKQAFWNSISTR